MFDDPKAYASQHKIDLAKKFIEEMNFSQLYIGTVSDHACVRFSSDERIHQFPRPNLAFIRDAPNKSGCLQTTSSGQVGQAKRLFSYTGLPVLSQTPKGLSHHFACPDAVKFFYVDKDHQKLPAKRDFCRGDGLLSKNTCYQAALRLVFSFCLVSQRRSN
jgi:hypothetical protein